MTQLADFIQQLQTTIDKEYSHINACLGSPYYVRENYERTLRLAGLIDAQTIAMGYMISQAKQMDCEK